MRLLLLLPIFTIMAISGYNLYIGTGLLAEMLLHLIVMALCLTFAVLIIRSFFSIKYVEVADAEELPNEAFEKLKLQHS